MDFETQSIVSDVGQLLMIGLAGPTVNRHEKKFIQRFQPSGVIYFRRNVESPRQLLKLSQHIWSLSEKGKPPLIGIDQEGGRVARLGPPFTLFPGNDYLGRAYMRTGSTRLTRDQAKAMARELKAIGVNLNFTPVADVDSRSGNPIIGSRAFGKNTALVSRLVSVTVKAYRAERVISCAKHFPGHGDTATDSHKVLPIVRASKEVLSRRELPPFRSAIRAGVPTLMSAHVIYTALDKKNSATLSPRIINGILRQRLGFNGVLISDDLEMGAIARHHSLAKAAQEAIEAGIDLLLVCKSLDEATSVVMGIQKALMRKELSPQRVREALNRVQTLKRRYLERTSPRRNARIFRGWEGHRRLAEKIVEIGKA